MMFISNFESLPKTFKFVLSSGECRPGPQWTLERSELSMRKSAIVWRSFHNHQSITSAHSSNLFFGAADPGDETYDRLSWD